MANKWFEETFLPSLETRMNNPKYPNQAILTDKQEQVCEKYMTYKACTDTYGRDFGIYIYTVGTKHYTMHFAGRYTFLHLDDDAKLEWFITDIKTKQDIVTFKTEEEMQRWIDENVDEDTGKIIATDNRMWTTGRRHIA